MAGLKGLAPGKHSRKAIYGAVVAFFGALGTAALKDGINFSEWIGITGAPVIGYLGVWAAVNEPEPGTGARRAG
jgi:hypothetical protein